MALSQNEFNTLLDVYSKLDVSKLSFSEQCELTAALSDFLERVKPIIVKEMMKDKSQSASFIIRL